MGRADLRWYFDPLPGQRAFLEATEPEIGYSGALGAGKTIVGCMKGRLLSQIYGGNEGLIVRKVAADLAGTTLKTLLEQVIPAEHIIQHHQTKKFITIPANNGGVSRIWYGGMDRIMRVGGTEFGWVYGDEAVEFEEDDWDMLMGRLRLGTVPFHQAFWTTNPGPPSHFLFERFLHPDHAERQEDGTIVVHEDGEAIRRVILANATDNPYHPPSYYRRLERMRGLHRLRFVEGQWVGYEGLVYGEFNPQVHVIHGFSVPADWRRVRAVDFGTGHAFSCSWYAQEPSTGTWIHYRQIYKTNERATIHGQHIVELSQGEAIEATISDHDRGDRLDLEAAGVDTIPADKEVDLGIQHVKTLLAPRPLITTVPTPAGDLTFPAGAPGILFMQDALVEEDPILLSAEKRMPLRTIDEFGMYSWQRDGKGRVTDKPKKEHDHGLDELRYFAMYVDPASTLVLHGLETRAGQVARRLQEEAMKAGHQVPVQTQDDALAELRRLRRRGAG